MTVRNEPTLGNLFAIFGKSKQEFKPKLSHDEIVNDALAAFTKAETQMSDAIKLIDTDIEAEQQAIKDAEQRIAEAGGSKDKLTRVLQRVQAFTA